MGAKEPEGARVAHKSPWTQGARGAQWAAHWAHGAHRAHGSMCTSDPWGHMRLLSPQGARSSWSPCGPRSQRGQWCPWGDVPMSSIGPEGALWHMEPMGPRSPRGPKAHGAQRAHCAGHGFAPSAKFKHGPGALQASRKDY